MKRKKKKASHGPSDPYEAQRGSMPYIRLHSIIQAELHRLSSPVTHISPADIDYAALDVSIAQAQAKNRRR